MTPEIIAALKANAGVPQSSQQGRARFVNGRYVLDEDVNQGKKGSGNQNPLTAFISEGSAVGGATLGTAILPGVGTIAGAGIAAFLGRLGENKIRDNEFRVGDAAQEGALSGTLAGIAPVYKAFKGARAVSKAGGSLDEAILSAQQGFSSKPGQKVANLGNRLVGESRGISAGVGKTGTRTGLSIKESTSLNKFMDDLGIQKGSALKQLEQVENLKGSLIKTQSEILGAGNSRLPAGLVSEIRKEVTDQIAKRPGMSISPQFMDDLSKLGKTRSVQSLNKFKMDLDDLINFNRSSAAPDPSLERLYKTLRTSVNKKLGTLSPDLKATNQTLTKLYDIEDLLQDAVKKAGSNSDLGAIGYRVPVLGNRVPGGLTQSLQNRTGRILSSGKTQGAIAGAAAATPQILGRVPGAMLQASSSEEDSSALRNLNSSSFGSSFPGSANGDMMTANSQSPNSATMIPANSSNIGGQYQNQGDLSSPFHPSNVQANVQGILQQGGDFKDVKEYLSLVEAMVDLTAPAGSNLTSAQQTRAVAAQNALRDMGQIEEAIATGKLGGLKALPGAGTAIGSRILGTEDLDAALFNIADNILRARSGAATPPDEVKRFVSNFLPRPTDSQEAKIAKLQRAKRELEGYLNPAAASDSTDLAEVMMQYQGGQLPY